MVARSRPAQAQHARLCTAPGLIRLVRPSRLLVHAPVADVSNLPTVAHPPGPILTDSFVCSGYDGSVLNAALGIDAFLDDVDNPDANKLGLLSSAISLGYLIGFFPSSWAGDRWGRKRPQIFGSAVVVVAVFVQCFALGGWKCESSPPLLPAPRSCALPCASASLMPRMYPSTQSLAPASCSASALPSP